MCLHVLHRLVDILMGFGCICGNIPFKQDHITFYWCHIGSTLMNPEKYAPESVVSSSNCLHLTATTSRRTIQAAYVGE